MTDGRIARRSGSDNSSAPTGMPASIEERVDANCLSHRSDGQR